MAALEAPVTLVETRIYRFHNRFRINPGHFKIGSQADNKRDDWEHWAGGTDPDFL